MLLKVLTLCALIAAISCQNTPWNSLRCGLSTPQSPIDDPRIVNGQLVVAGQYGWQGALYRSAGNSFFCGCSLITDQYATTAAHCFANPNPALYYAEFGNLDRINKESWVIRVGIIGVRNHASYNSQLIMNDVSLLKFSSSIAFTDQVKPICMPETRLDYSNQPATVSGWGAGFFGGAASRYLMHSTTNLVLTDDRCIAKYGAFRINVTSQICHGDTGGNTGPCQGDSGGPLKVLTTLVDDTPRFTLIGVVSWGINCGTGGVYARVDHYADWFAARMVEMEDL